MPQVHRQRNKNRESFYCTEKILTVMRNRSARSVLTLNVSKIDWKAA